MILFIIIYMLLFVIFLLAVFAIAQIRAAGMKVKDFWSFIEANEMLDKLYRFSKKYEKLSNQEQIIFLKEAEKVFDAFDKVPEILWEEEYQKYMEVLDKYKDVKMVRWARKLNIKNKLQSYCSLFFYTFNFFICLISSNKLFTTSFFFKYAVEYSSKTYIKFL